MDEIIGVYSEELISVIFSRGDGTEKNPVRLVKQYRMMNSEKFLFEIDPFINQDWSNWVAASKESSDSIKVTVAFMNAFRLSTE